ICDVAERCTGTSATCPTDGFALATTLCRASAGVCDIAENCTGTSNTCPADVRVSAGTTCREATTDPCDLAEACNGTSAVCPADGVKTGHDGVRCAFERDFSPAICADEQLPRFLVKRLKQAGAAVNHAVHSPFRWLGVADRQLGRAIRRLERGPQTADHAAPRGPVAPAPSPAQR